MSYPIDIKKTKQLLRRGFSASPENATIQAPETPKTPNQNWYGDSGDALNGNCDFLLMCVAFTKISK